MIFENEMRITGNIGGTPTLRYTGDRTPVTNFSVATNRLNRAGNDKVSWHRVAVFGRLAEIVCARAGRGSAVHVKGPIEYKVFFKDGMEIEAAEIQADIVLILDTEPVHHDSEPSRY